MEKLNKANPDIEPGIENGLENGTTKLDMHGKDGFQKRMIMSVGKQVAWANLDVLEQKSQRRIQYEEAQVLGLVTVALARLEVMT